MYLQVSDRAAICIIHSKENDYSKAELNLYIQARVHNHYLK